MPLPTTAATGGQLVAADLGPGGPGIVAGFQSDWDDTVRKAAGAFAWAQTMRRELGEQLFIRVVGGDASAQKMVNFAARFKKIYAGTQKLASGDAVIVAYRAGAAGPVYLGIYKASAARGELGAGPFVYFALAAGTVLTAAYLYVKNFGLSIQQLKSEADRVSLEIVSTMGAAVRDIARTDPQAAARIAEANAKALETARQAQAAPDSWIAQLMGGPGGGFDRFFKSPLLWIAALAWFSQRGRA